MGAQRAHVELRLGSDDAAAAEGAGAGVEGVQVEGVVLRSEDRRAARVALPLEMLEVNALAAGHLLVERLAAEAGRSRGVS